MNESIAISKLNAQRFAEVSTLYAKLAETQELLNTKTKMLETQQETCKLHQQEIDRLYTQLSEEENTSVEEEVAEVRNTFSNFDWYDLDNIQYSLIHLQQSSTDTDSLDYDKLIKIMDSLKFLYTQINNAEEGQA